MENKKDAKFCAGCGTSLETVEEQKEVPNSGKSKNKGKKYLFAGLAGVHVIIAIIVAGIWVMKENQVKKQYQNHLASGQKYLEELNYESAEDSYLKAMAIDPKEPEPYLKLIDTYIAQEKYDDAVKIAKQAQKKVPEKDVEEFQKLEQEYDSVINYEWVVEPTIEADDIYYVRLGSGERKSENERRKQYESSYAVIQQGEKLGLIDMNGTMRTGMDYAWIESGYLMEKLDKTGLSYYDAFYNDELHPDIITDFFDEKGQYIYYQKALHNLAEWEGWAYTFQEPEQTIPVRNAEGTIEVSDPYAWWNQQRGKYGLYKNGTMITDFIYGECGSVSEGLIAVKKDDKWGYVDENGNEIIPIEYDASWQQFEDETVVATQERKIIDFCYGASGGYIPLVQEGKWKLADLEGKTAIPTGIFEKICPVYHGKCWVKKDGKWGVIAIGTTENSDLGDVIAGVWNGKLERTSDFIEDGEYPDECRVELNSDGTIVSQCYRNTDTGTYEVVGENRIKAIFDKNYYEAPGIERELVAGYTYTVLYTYDEDENVLHADYDDDFDEMGYRTKQAVTLTR